MNLAAVQSILDRIDLSRIPWTIQLHAYATLGDIVIGMMMRVREREGDEMIAVETHKLLPGSAIHALTSEQAIVDLVLCMAREAVAHELEESFRFEGARWQDPHERPLRSAPRTVLGAVLEIQRQGLTEEATKAS